MGNESTAFQRLPAAVLCLLALAACASREVLLPYPAEPPAAVSFAGTWELRGDLAEIERRLSAAIRQTDGVRDGSLQREPVNPNRPGRRSSGRISGGLVYVFFENGRQLKITQTNSALFVSFDRAVVEEYRFGENREIRVGQASAQRVSGWENGDYVIETLDRNGMKLTERYQLAADGQALTRRVTFRGKNDDTVTVIIMYRRQ